MTRYRHDWEASARSEIMPHLVDLNAELRGPFQVFGVAMVNEQTGEACYLEMNKPDGSLFAQDAARDIMGDACHAAQDAEDASRSEFERLRKGGKP